MKDDIIDIFFFYIDPHTNKTVSSKTKYLIKIKFEFMKIKVLIWNINTLCVNRSSQIKNIYLYDKMNCSPCDSTILHSPQV